MTDNIADAMPFSRPIGVRVTSATAERIVASLEVTDVTDDLCTTEGRDVALVAQTQLLL